jgi:hypothetical protein
MVACRRQRKAADCLNRAYMRASAAALPMIAFMATLPVGARFPRRPRDDTPRLMTDERFAANGMAGLAMSGAMPMAAIRSSGLAGLSSGVTLASAAPVRHLRRVNLIERQRPGRGSPLGRRAAAGQGQQRS